MGGQRRTTLSREGWYYVGALGIAIAWAVLVEANLLLLLAGAFLGALVASWRLARAMIRGVEVRWRLPTRIYAGESFLVSVEVTNTRTRLGSWALVAQEEVSGEEGRGGKANVPLRAFFPYVPPQATCRRVFLARPPERGRYRLGPPRVWTRFPFGLLRHTSTLERSGSLTVYPRLGCLASGWMERYRAAALGDGGGRRPSRVSNEFYGVREWQSGDGLRRLHWRASARHAKLVVRQHEQPRNRSLAVLVDLWQPAEPDAADRESVERAVSLAATVVVAVCSAGRSNLALAVAGRSPSWTTGPASMPRMEQALEQLAVAQATGGDALQELLQRVLGQVRPDDELVLIGTRHRDLRDLEQCHAAGNSPAQRTAAQRIRVIHVADPRLGEYFRIE